MSSEQSPIRAAASRVYDMLLRRQAFDAMQLADEVAADAASQWRRDPSPAAAGDLLVASCTLAEAQVAAGRFKPAVNTALRAVAAVGAAPDGRELTDGLAEPMMMCCLTAWNALEQLLTLASPDSEAMRDAVGEATRSLGSLLYRHYYAAGRANPDCAALADAYEALRVISSLVAIDPAADPAAALRSLAAALAAAGLAQ